VEGCFHQEFELLNWFSSETMLIFSRAGIHSYVLENMNGALFLKRNNFRKRHVIHINNLFISRFFNVIIK
jgi:hypothetical protein